VLKFIAGLHEVPIMRTITGVAIGLLLIGSQARGDDWPQFRGPGANGLSAEKDLPKEWGADKNVLWKVNIHGRGWSSPIVWGDKVFLTAAFSEKEPKAVPGGGFGKGPPGGGKGPPGGGGGGFGRPGGGKPPDMVFQFEIYCLDRGTGKEIWKQVAHEGKPRIATHRSNTFASETPVTDGERVYAYFGMTGLFCYDVAGKFVWKKDLGAYPMQMGWGTSSSPVLDSERLFLQIDNEEKSFLVALDKKTGEEVWRESRTERSNWGSPIVWKNKERTEIVTVGSQKVRSYDPASGKALWELSMGGGRCTASPVGDDAQLYVGTAAGFGGGGGFGKGPPGGEFGKGPPGGGGRGGGGSLFAVKAGASGDVTPKMGETTSAGVAWSVPRAGPSMASPLVYQGYVYILEQNGGMVSCFDAKTGKTAYQRERIPNARAFWASPWAYDGKIFCLDDGGTTHVLAAGPEFKVLSTNSLKDQFWATPAIAGGSLILRGVENIYCVKQ
jgi:outer membrane protein assembly factor BamB